eukprot:5844424-Amphidinium_carterae.1
MQIPSATPESPATSPNSAGKVAFHTRRATGVRPASLTTFEDQEQCLHSHHELVGILASEEHQYPSEIAGTIADPSVIPRVPSPTRREPPGIADTQQDH